MLSIKLTLMYIKDNWKSFADCFEAPTVKKILEREKKKLKKEYLKKLVEERNDVPICSK